MVDRFLEFVGPCFGVHNRLKTVVKIRSFFWSCFGGHFGSTTRHEAPQMNLPTNQPSNQPHPHAWILAFLDPWILEFLHSWIPAFQTSKTPCVKDAGWRALDARQWPADYYKYKNITLLLFVAQIGSSTRISLYSFSCRNLVQVQEYHITCFRGTNFSPRTRTFTYDVFADSFATCS